MSVASECRIQPDEDFLRSTAAAPLQKRSGAIVEDILNRLCLLETALAEIRAKLAACATKADLEPFATKIELAALRAELKEQIHGLRVEMTERFGKMAADMNLLRADMNARDVTMIKWMVGTALTTSAVAFSAAKLIH